MIGVSSSGRRPQAAGPDECSDVALVPNQLRGLRQHEFAFPHEESSAVTGADERDKRKARAGGPSESSWER